jgi:YVTN family beta-propeller protein
MAKTSLTVAGCLLLSVYVGSHPLAQAVSGHDRVYTADQTSNTVSVIDPSVNKLLGVIRLGERIPGALSPLYRGALLVHGLGYSPDSRTLAVVSIGSNSVTLLDTATNLVKGTIYVGRSPHEAAFTRNGRELWVTVRGESYISVIDPFQMRETARIDVANGPGMTAFTSDGKYAFVCSSFVPELAVIDVVTHAIVHRARQASSFCPNIAVSPDDDEVWITLKDVGKVQVFSAHEPFEERALIDTGSLTNHVNFAQNGRGQFAYVTIGGSNEVKVFQAAARPQQVATIAVGDLPHGLWPSSDGTRMYVALENGGAAAVIDTVRNVVVANVPIGQTSQALVYVPNVEVKDGSAAALSAPEDAAGLAHVHLLGTAAYPSARASASISPLGLADFVQISVSGLAPATVYRVYLTPSNQQSVAGLIPLAVLKTNSEGSGIVQAIGPLKRVAADGPALKNALIIAEAPPRARIVLREVE